MHAHDAGGGADGLPPGVGVDDVQELVKLNYTEWGGKWGASHEVCIHICVCVCIYIYIYICPPGVGVDDVLALLKLNYTEWGDKWGATHEVQSLVYIFFYL